MRKLDQVLEQILPQQLIESKYQYQDLNYAEIGEKYKSRQRIFDYKDTIKDRKSINHIKNNRSEPPIVNISLYTTEVFALYFPSRSRTRMVELYIDPLVTYKNEGEEDPMINIYQQDTDNSYHSWSPVKPKLLQSNYSNIQLSDVTKAIGEIYEIKEYLNSSASFNILVYEKDKKEGIKKLQDKCIEFYQNRLDTGEYLEGNRRVGDEKRREKMGERIEYLMYIVKNLI